jgi:proteic killer suppression protein
MNIRGVKHKGLRKLIENDDAGGLQPQVVDKVRKILAFLQDMESEGRVANDPDLEGPSAYRRS